MPITFPDPNRYSEVITYGGVPYLVCKECGSLVAWDKVETHDQWHKKYPLK